MKIFMAQIPPQTQMLNAGRHLFAIFSKLIKDMTIQKAFKLIFFLIFISVTCFGQGNPGFSLRGYINNEKIEKIYFGYYNDIEKKGINDSAEVINGNFLLKGRISHGALLIIKLYRGKEVDEDKSIYTFIDPADMNIKLNYSPFKVLNITNSPTYLEYDSLDQQKNIIKKNFDYLFHQYESAKSNDIKDSISTLLLPYYENIKKLDYSFFTGHPNSFVTGYLLQHYYRKFSVDTLDMLYNSMSNLLKKSIYGEQLSNVIQRRDARKETICEGCKAPNFRGTTFNGKSVELNDFRGKYVVLDFWASWCVPCRESTPHLIQIYNKYHSKGLEIIAIADDDQQPNEWKKAIKKDKAKMWYHILNGKRYMENGAEDRSNAITQKYYTSALPTKIIISPEGAIIGEYVGTDNDNMFYEKIAALF
ncbi:thioredoxin-like domain-containing protein [Parafilimonas sp.]|uniref:thioredoxin-like domain-containing protein n=1 Tax=Parafilimonas sp. TaxID=1969739 RepID=UPI0039E310F0